MGPIGILCIRRTIEGGRKTGFVTGLGAASADAFYASLAAFGLTFITNTLVQGQTWLRLGGAFFLFYLGTAIFFRAPARKEAALKPRSLLGDFLATFFLTLTNPLTIIFFAAVFSALGVRENRMDYAAALPWVLGVFFGSAIWWLLLSFLAGALRNKLASGHLRWVNRISGGVIVAFGFFALFG